MAEVLTMDFTSRGKEMKVKERKNKEREREREREIERDREREGGEVGKEGGTQGEERWGRAGRRG